MASRELKALSNCLTAHTTLVTLHKCGDLKDTYRSMQLFWFLEGNRFFHTDDQGPVLGVAGQLLREAGGGDGAGRRDGAGQRPEARRAPEALLQGPRHDLQVPQVLVQDGHGLRLRGLRGSGGRRNNRQLSTYD